MSPKLKCKQSDKLPVFINYGKHRPGGVQWDTACTVASLSQQPVTPLPSPPPLPPSLLNSSGRPLVTTADFAGTSFMSVFEMRVTYDDCLAPRSKVNGRAAFAAVSPRRHYRREPPPHSAFSRLETRCQTLTLCHSYAYCTFSVIAVGIQRRRGVGEARRRGRRRGDKTAHTIHRASAGRRRAPHPRPDRSCMAQQSVGPSGLRSVETGSNANTAPKWKTCRPFIC